MWAAWGGSIVLRWKQLEWLAQTFVLLACSLFGAGIMLISQMYHIQGEPSDATWMWAIGTVIVVILTRSVPALCLAIGLLFTWDIMQIDDHWTNESTDLGYLGYLAIVAGLSYWLRSRFAGHLVVLTFSAWIIVSSAIGLGSAETPYVPLFLLLLSLFAVICLLFVDRQYNWFGGSERGFLFYLTATAGIVIVMLGFEYELNLDRSTNLAEISFWAALLVSTVGAILLALKAAKEQHENAYDLAVGACIVFAVPLFIIFAHNIPYSINALVLALSIWILRMGWRMEFRALSVLEPDLKLIE